MDETTSTAMLQPIHGVGIYIQNMCVLDHTQIIHHKLHLNPFSYFVSQLFFFHVHTLQETLTLKKHIFRKQ